MRARARDFHPLRGVDLDPVLLLPVAVVGGLLASWGARAGGAGNGRVAADMAVSWSFALAATLALLRPSLRRTGALMAVISLTWFLADLQLASDSLAWTLGWLFGPLPEALLVLLVVSYPSGRIWSLFARLLVVAAAVATVGTAFLAALFRPGERNLLLVHANQALADDLDRTGELLGIAITVLLAVLIVNRLVDLRGAARRNALPFLGGSLIATAAYTVQLSGDATGHGGFASRLELAERLLTALIPAGFVGGLFWWRLRRSGASNLVVELRESGVETLRDRLAAALGDPSLEIAFWLEGRGGYVDATGRGVDLPTTNDRATTPILANGIAVAALIHDPALLEEPDLVESVRAAAELVLENERLAAEVRAQLAEVRASRARIVEAADNERRRLERDLHDGAQQRLVAMSLKLSLAQAGADPAAMRPLAQAQDDVEVALAELREFARGVHSTVLREDGLDAATEALARRSPLPVEILGEVGTRLPDSVELAAYYFISEALTNVVKHARASRATVTLRHAGATLTVIVCDDGVGGADAKRGSGLCGLADRLAALDGTLVVQSAHGDGTTLNATIPCG